MDLISEAEVTEQGSLTIQTWDKCYMKVTTSYLCPFPQVVDVNYKALKAQVKLVVPLQCETRGCELTEEAMNILLEATLHKVPLQELRVVFDESGDFDQTALALEHLR